MSNSSTPSPFGFFDPLDEVLVVERQLPHWAQDGVLCYLTWRTLDSIPTPALDRWQQDRNEWLRAHAIDPERTDWREQLRRLPVPDQRLFRREFGGRWEAMLDECHGACALRDPLLAGIVADSLRHFNGQRYRLTDFVVMPNHVRILAAFPNAERMLAECESWKHYRAVQLNKRLGRKGRFWQTDGFDHLVRNGDQFDRFRKYIADNPRRANLTPGEYIHATFPITDE